MSTVGSLIIDLRGNVAGFQRDMGRANSILTQNVASMRRSVTGLVSAFRGLAGAAGIGFGVSALTGFIKSSFNAAAGLSELSEQLGTTAEHLQVLQFAAEQSGVKAGELESGMAIFARTAGDAATGTKTAADADDGMVARPFRQTKLRAALQMVRLVWGACALRRAAA